MNQVRTIFFILIAVIDNTFLQFYFLYSFLNKLYISVNERDVIRAAISADHSSERLRDVPITVANGRTIRLSAVGINDSGEAYANSSSLSLSWGLDNCDGLASWDGGYDNSWERYLALHNESGLVLEKSIKFYLFIYYLQCYHY